MRYRLVTLKSAQHKSFITWVASSNERGSFISSWRTSDLLVVFRQM